MNIMSTHGGEDRTIVPPFNEYRTVGKKGRFTYYTLPYTHMWWDTRSGKVTSRSVTIFQGYARVGLPVLGVGPSA